MSRFLSIHQKLSIQYNIEWEMKVYHVPQVMMWPSFSSFYFFFHVFISKIFFRVFQKRANLKIDWFSDLLRPNPNVNQQSFELAVGSHLIRFEALRDTDDNHFFFVSIIWFWLLSIASNRKLWQSFSSAATFSQGAPIDSWRKTQFSFQNQHSSTNIEWKKCYYRCAV